jgi:hypothetical protein
MILFYIIKLDSILPSLVESSGREDGMHLSSPPATAHCWWQIVHLARCLRGIDCDVVVRKKSWGRVGVLLASSGAERRGEERSKRPEDGSQRAEQRTRHDGASEDDGDESARRWKKIRMAWLARPSSIVPAYFEWPWSSMYYWYKFLSHVQGAGRLSLKSKTTQKIAELSQVDDRRLAGRPHNTVGWLCLFCHEKSQPRIKGRILTYPGPGWSRIMLKLLVLVLETACLICLVPSTRSEQEDRAHSFVALLSWRWRVVWAMHDIMLVIPTRSRPLCFCSWGTHTPFSVGNLARKKGTTPPATQPIYSLFTLPPPKQISKQMVQEEIDGPQAEIGAKPS